MDELENLLSEHIKIFEADKETLYASLEYIVKNGVGSGHLEEIVDIRFGLSDEKYINELIHEIKKKEDNIIHVSRTLLTWYESWKKTFPKVNSNNLGDLIKSQPYHTWLYCILNGKYLKYQEFLNVYPIVIDKNEYVELKKVEKTENNKMNNIDNDHLNRKNSEKLRSNLYYLWEEDIDVKIKLYIFEKNIAVFHDGNWDEQMIEQLKSKYHFRKLEQCSSLAVPKSKKNYDYILFLTSRALHDVQNKLESMYSKSSIFLIDQTNPNVVMEEWINQIKGKGDLLNAHIQ